jgi:hypothetical protein
MGAFTEHSARVDDLVTRGFEWSHAWSIVARQSPARVSAPVAARGAARNGHAAAGRCRNPICDGVMRQNFSDEPRYSVCDGCDWTHYEH